MFLDAGTTKGVIFTVFDSHRGHFSDYSPVKCDDGLQNCFLASVKHVIKVLDSSASYL